jgi:hypothetical protein
MALSDQLTDLAHRTRQLEDTASAAEAQNRAKLEKERDKLHSEMQTEAKQIQSKAKEGKSDAQTWWAGVTVQAEKQRNDLHQKIEERKAERKVDKAMRHADDAESYAVNMIQVAAYCIDAAEYAVADAVIARSQADDLVTAR